MWKKFVLPARPLFDKVAALCVAIEATTGKLEWSRELTIEYFNAQDQQPGKDNLARWEQEGAYLIDLGPNQYRLRGKGSACGVVVEDSGADLNTRGDLKRLVEITDRNNQTGFLKGFGSLYNAPYLLRELYKPGSFTRMETTVEAAAHVVFTDLRFRNMRHTGNFPRHAGDGFVKTNLEIMKVTSAEDPFTMGRYMMQMYCLGDELAWIQSRIEFWNTAKKRAESADLKARQTAREIVDMRQVRNYKVAVIHTNDDRAARALFVGEHKPTFVVARRLDSGAVVILTNRERHNPALRTSMRRLTEKLEETEAGSWMFNEPMIASMNRGGTATRRTVDEIVALIGDTARVVDTMENTSRMRQ
ncbi:MAG: hypothetical protein KW804_00435 [Candidatus Doudnabacteria bacterium]|nr:hypothetical protein [Candidatus Doudnabacteria bacterium]